MNPSLTFDVELDETDPIRRFLLLAVAMADQDRATALIIGVSQSDENSTRLRYRVDGEWSDFPPYPAPMRKVATELESMAGICEPAREGVLDRTVDGVRLRWRVQATAPKTEYTLTPIDGEQTKTAA